MPFFSETKNDDNNSQTFKSVKDEPESKKNPYNFWLSREELIAVLIGNGDPKQGDMRDYYEAEAALEMLIFVGYLEERRGRDGKRYYRRTNKLHTSNAERWR